MKLNLISESIRTSSLPYSAKEHMINKIIDHIDRGSHTIKYKQFHNKHASVPFEIYIEFAPADQNAISGRDLTGSLNAEAGYVVIIITIFYNDDILQYINQNRDKLMMAIDHEFAHGARVVNMDRLARTGYGTGYLKSGQYPMKDPEFDADMQAIMSFMDRLKASGVKEIVLSELLEQFWANIPEKHGSLVNLPPSYSKRVIKALNRYGYKLKTNPTMVVL